MGHKDTFANLWVVAIVKKNQTNWVHRVTGWGVSLVLAGWWNYTLMKVWLSWQPLMPFSRFPREDLFHKKTKQNFYSSFLFSNVRTTPSHMKNTALADLLNEDILAP